MKKSILSALLCICLLLSLALPIFADPEPGEIVTVTVNYVYDSNKAMVSTPYTAQIAKGAAFVHDIAAPKVINYSVPSDKIEGLGTGITFDEDADGKGTVHFNLDEVNEDIVVNLYYVAGEAKYTVKHYYQNLEDDNYGEPTVYELTGDIDAYTDVAAEAKPGYICTGVPQYIIAADGTTVVELYYDRIYYTVIFDANGGINGPKPIYAKYGSTYDYTTFTAPNRSGYVFGGWNITPSNVVDSNVTYTANWIPDVSHADYAIVFWGQNANDDNYSYLYSQPAHGSPGDEVTWDSTAYICEGAHNHSPSCYNLTCGMVEHVHDATACGMTCGHVHTAACYGGTTLANDDIINKSDVKKAFTDLLGGLVSGKIYRLDCSAALGNHGNNYYLYFDGKWYNTTSASVSGSYLAHDEGNFAGSHISSNREDVYVYNAKPCSHLHTDACYACGKTAHTHTGYDGACYTVVCGKVSHIHTADCIRMGTNAPDSNLWHFDHSDTIEVSADGSSILNVYFDRNEFTLTFKSGSSSSATTYGTITDRWGADISDEYVAICNSSGQLAWSPSGTSHFTNYVGIMPQHNDTYTRYSMSSGSQTMTYYGADLNGEYQVMFTLSANFGTATVTVEDMYDFEGFTINRSKSTSTGNRMSGAKFYYDRNKYNLYYYSSSNGAPDHTANVLYEDSLGKYPYTPSNPPASMESGAVFVGWYLNPERSGEQVDLSAYTMPAANLALYAKWVNGLFKVETFTDISLSEYYTYDGYDGCQENIVKYTTATAPTAPSAEGLIFVGWFYQEDGAEYPFSYTMPITQDYQLYPKYSDTAIVQYTVHYYLEDTEIKVADDVTRDIRIGTVATEKAKMGTDLNLITTGTSPNEYFPYMTSTSVKIDADGKEIIFYYRISGETIYTIHYVMQDGVDAEGKPVYKDIADPVEKTTTYSIVTENYKPIENYTADFFQITKELSLDPDENHIYFIYTPNFTTLTITKTCSDSNMDPNQTFLFHVSGMSASTSSVSLDVVIQGTGSVTIKDIPVGSYVVTEDTNWSWRYTPDQINKTVDAGVDGGTVTFANTKTDSSNTQDDYDFIRNIFG